jgi:hypothetical protein
MAQFDPRTAQIKESLMTNRIAWLFAWTVILVSSAAAQTYYPDRLDWQRRTPQQMGLNAAVPAAPESSVTFRGAGSNIVYVDWQNDLVVVVRWSNGSAVNEFIGKVLAALNQG